MSRDFARSGSALLLGASLAFTLSPSAVFAAENPAADDPVSENPEKRPVPDYDGRPPRTTPGQVLLWIPRILLSPAYLVTEYVVRRPLGFVVTAAEKAQVPALLYDFFAFGRDHKAGIVPVAFIDFGFEPSVGLYFFWDDAGFDGHDLRLRGSTWGDEWLSGNVTERFHISERLDLTLSGTAIRRPDYAFYGIGPDTRETSLSRYGADTVDARLTTRFRFAGESYLEAVSGYESAFFRAGDYPPDPSIEERVVEGAFAEPPGYRGGYRGAFSGAKLKLDTRPVEAEGGSGLRLELGAEHGTDLLTAPVSGWLRYGATVGGFWDLTDHARVLSFSVSALFVDPLGERPVPFTELVTLGGPAMMPGFREGRLYDRSAFVASLRYSWPIWIWLNGSLQAAAGNVFDEQLSGMRLERLRFSGALGIESNGSRDSIFQALLGFGTETFESGAQVHALRLTVGARSGF
jgi:hypothetical protein